MSEPINKAESDKLNHLRRERAMLVHSLDRIILSDNDKNNDLREEYELLIHQITQEIEQFN